MLELRPHLSSGGRIFQIRQKLNHVIQGSMNHSLEAKSGFLPLDKVSWRGAWLTAQLLEHATLNLRVLEIEAHIGGRVYLKKFFCKTK